jgi:hypothetical protein
MRRRSDTLSSRQRDARACQPSSPTWIVVLGDLSEGSGDHIRDDGQRWHPVALCSGKTRCFPRGVPRNSTATSSIGYNGPPMAPGVTTRQFDDMSGDELASERRMSLVQAASRCVREYSECSGARRR